MSKKFRDNVGQERTFKTPKLLTCIKLRSKLNQSYYYWHFEVLNYNVIQAQENSKLQGLTYRKEEFYHNFSPTNLLLHVECERW